MRRYVSEKWPEIVVQLLVTILGVYLGYLAGSAQATRSWERAREQNSRDSHERAARKLELARREAEYNFNRAIKIRELGLTASSREFSAERLTFDMLHMALADEASMELMDLKAVVLAQEYLHAGAIAEDLRDSYHQLAMQQNYQLPPAQFESVRVLHETMVYNAAAFMAVASTLNEHLQLIVKASYLEDDNFKVVSMEIDRVLDERTRQALDGQYERPPRPERPKARPGP